MPIDETLINLTKVAIAKLELAMRECVKSLEKDGYDKYNFETIGLAIGLVREFQKPIFERRPDLELPKLKEDPPDPPLTKEQIEIVGQLNEIDIKRIDKALLSNTCKYWRKVARVVGTTMLEEPGGIQGIPDIYYSLRIQHLVKKGKLESQGDLSYMGRSEVRLPSRDKE